MLITEVLSQLKGVKRAGSGKWMARCCCHDDSTPSLSLKELSDGRILLNCFGGCSYESLKLALGLNGNSAPYIPPIRRKPEPPEPIIDFQSMWQRWMNDTDYQLIDGLAMGLGVEPESLQSLDVAWTGSAWAFPMRDARDKMIGVRLRDPKGGKYAVKGSKQGLFLSDRKPEGTLYLCEGPSDTAAGLSLGLSVVGRPSALGQEPMILEYLKLHSVRRLVLIVDNDRAGLAGAQKLQTMLRVPSTTFYPPCKDLRVFLSLGGDSSMIESAVRDLCWVMPKC